MIHPVRHQRHYSAFLGILLWSYAALALNQGVTYAEELGEDIRRLEPTRFRNVKIPATNNVFLDGNVIEPRFGTKNPAIVFISSWGLNDKEYLAQAAKLADDGYTVLSYTARGFWGSGDAIDTGGPLDIADATSAIDWLLKNTQADPDRIGFAGVSYGAGISLIASAFDKRIKAVAALSGWTDLVESLYGEGTRRPQAAFLLQAVGAVVGKLSPGLRETLDNYFGNKNVDKVIAYGKVRSAATYIDAINRNKPAIFLSNSFGDSLFPPNQLVEFFQKYDGPKRLEFAPGDHIVVEATGLIGLPNQVWTNTIRWLDRYVAGKLNGIEKEGPIFLRTISGEKADFYPTWDAVAPSTARLGLQDINLLTGTGKMGGSPSKGWTQQILTGIGTTADGGVALLTNGLAALIKVYPMLWLPSVDRLRGAVWVTDEFSSEQRIRGISTLHLTIRPSKPTGTIVAYMLDVDNGTGKLFNFIPYSWKGATPGKDLSIDVRFSATAYDLPRGRRLALIVDSKDSLFSDENGFNDAIIIAGESWLDLSLNNK